MSMSENDVQGIKQTLSEVNSQLQEQAQRAQHDRQMAENNKAQVDELLTKQNELQANLQGAEQELAALKQQGGAPAKPQSFGRQFVEGEKFQSFAQETSPRGRVDMTFNAAVHDITYEQNGDALVMPTRVPGIVAGPERRLTIRDLLTAGRMDGNVLEHVQETGFSNNADAVKEGDKKPQSDIEFELKTTSAKVIAHYMKASRQVLSDASQLASYIDGRLLYGLAYKEEDQILNGDGSGQNLNGITSQADSFDAPISVDDETIIDRLRLAMLQAQLAEYPATGIVMNPMDWARIELLKDDNANYIIGNPQGTAEKRLWGRGVVDTQAMGDGKFLTGAFQLGAQLFDRWRARVELSTENEDDFVKNMVTMLAEERLALAIYRPEAFIYGDIQSSSD